MLPGAVTNIGGPVYEERIRLLASVFSVDIAAYSVMSNHYHLVVKLSPDEVEPWSNDEVLSRWCSLYKGPPLVQRYYRGITSAQPNCDESMNTQKPSASDWET